MTSGTKGLIIYQGKILLILRDDKPDIPYPNTWECVGGGQEAGESLAGTGIREVQEELGIKPKNYTFLGVENYGTRQAGRFVALLTDDEYRNINFGNEGQRYGWFSLSEALNLDMAPGLKRFLKDNLIVLQNIIDNHNPINPKEFILTDSI